MVWFIYQTHLVSGSITHCVGYHPEHYDGNPPKRSFDIFDPQVLARFERFVGANPGHGGRRLLFTHLPIVPLEDLISAAHPDAALLRPNYVIEEEGRACILETLRRTGVRHVFGGHCHVHSRNVVEGDEFVTTPSFRPERDGRSYRVGFREITWRDGELMHAVRPVD